MIPTSMTNKAHWNYHLERVLKRNPKRKAKTPRTYTDNEKVKMKPIIK